MNYYQQNRDKFLEGLKTFLRIPSISTLDEHKGDVRKAADFVARELRRILLRHVMRVWILRGIIR